MTISCLGKDTRPKLIFLPDSIEELLELGAQKFNCTPTRVLFDGAHVEDIALIRDGDHLILKQSGVINFFDCFSSKRKALF